MPLFLIFKSLWRAPVVVTEIPRASPKSSTVDVDVEIVTMPFRHVEMVEVEIIASVATMGSLCRPLSISETPI